MGDSSLALSFLRGRIPALELGCEDLLRCHARLMKSHAPRPSRRRRSIHSTECCIMVHRVRAPRYGRFELFGEPR